MKALSLLVAATLALAAPARADEPEAFSVHGQNDLHPATQAVFRLALRRSAQPVRRARVELFAHWYAQPGCSPARRHRDVRRWRGRAGRSVLRPAGPGGVP